MDNLGNVDLLTAFKRLMADNKSQEARLAECEKTINSRDNEIAMLQKMLDEANEYRSGTDNQVSELKELQRYINGLQQQSAAADYLLAGKQLQAGNTVNAGQQLQDLTTQYACLKAQLEELQAQLLEVNNRNLLLQQQTGRIAALESMLENGKEEINKSKKGVGKKA